MSLVTFIAAASPSTSGSVVLPEDLTFTSRRLYKMVLGHVGNPQIVGVSITNVIADTGATFTATLGTNNWNTGTGNIARGTEILLPRKGLRCSTRGVTTISIAYSTAITINLLIDYEKG